MKKRWIAILLCFALMLSALMTAPAVGALGEPVQGTSAEPAQETPTEAATEPLAEPTSAVPAEPASAPATETATEPAGAQPTQPATEPAADPATVPATEAPTEPPTEAPTEPVEVIPRVTKVVPAYQGVTISFTAYEGAVKYRLFTKKSDGSGWKGIGDTAALSYTFKGVTPYKTDVYTVRAIGADGKFISGYDKEGYSFLYRTVPVLKSIENVNEGVKITWSGSVSDPGYRFYVKAAGGWKLLTETTDNSYIDTEVTSGSSYTYTVKVFDIEHQEALSFFDRTGITIKYIATPQIVSCAPVQGGVQIKWNAVAGAERYRVFYKNGTGWKTIANTTATSLTHTNLTVGQEYIYTVRVLDWNSKYISGFDRAGFPYTCLTTPVLKSAQSVSGGVQVSWNAVEGAEAYRVYVKNGSSWKGVANTDAATYLDTNVTSGSTYTYTVRAIDPETGAMRSYFDRTGVSAKYVSTPEITAITPVDGGLKFTWSAVAGAAKYRLFYKNGSSWKTIANVSGTTATVTSLAADADYIFTLRATDSNGKYISAYNTAGWAYRYIAPPAIGSIVKADDGVVLSWDAVEGASGYRLYRKSFGGGWAKITDTADTSYTDAAAPAGTAYTYTLRTLDEAGQLNSFHLKDTPYYYGGVLANGKLNCGGTTVYFENGYVRQGYVTVGGKTYYYDNSGNLVKNGIAGTAADGYRYADANGVISTTARLALTYGGYDWNVLDGKAYKVTTEKARTLHRALKITAKVTNASMTKAQRLRAVWNHLTTAYGECSPRSFGSFSMSWVETYANDIFVNGKGDCFSYAAAFAYLAKAAGYDNSYACNSGGHGWTEIDGLVYDPEWSFHNKKYTYYGMSYDDPCDVPYKSALNLGSSWSHIKITG